MLRQFFYDYLELITTYPARQMHLMLTVLVGLFLFSPDGYHLFSLGLFFLSLFLGALILDAVGLELVKWLQPNLRPNTRMAMPENPAMKNINLSVSASETIQPGLNQEK